MESQRKRKKERRKVNLIDDLPETLLVLEIFSRLNNFRDVIVCKSVSKSWNSIISSSSLHHKQSFALILNTDPTRCAATNDTSLEAWKGFQLDNYIDLKFGSSKVYVLASYKDVLICTKRSEWNIREQFYLVNPVTMRWTRVPEITLQYLQHPIGLSGDVSKNRFYVVQMIPFPDYTINFNVFDSKQGRWRQLQVNHRPLLHHGWWPMKCQAVNFNGVLHWLARDGPITTYNPEFKHRHECRFIHRSQEMSYDSYGDLSFVSETLTVSTGHLRIIQLVCYPLPSDHHQIVIWTLVDYKESIWKQENETIYFRDMLSDLPWIQDYMRGYTLSMETYENLTSRLMDCPRYDLEGEYSRIRKICPQPLHCHPENPLLMYLYLSEGIVLLDVVTKKLRLIAMNSQSDQNSHDIVMPITLHLDPSLVPDHERVLLLRE